MPTLISASLHLFATEISGRTSAISNGYRPTFRFKHIDGYWGGDIFEMTPDPLPPGGDASIRFELISWEELEPHLGIGTAFSIWESRPHGEGVITGFESVEDIPRIRFPHPGN